jgi:hypothetical protein
MTAFGIVTNIASLQTVFVESAQADDLEGRVNIALDAIFDASPARAVTAISLAGAGDGHTFTVAIDSAAISDVTGGLALPGGASVSCYLASESEALTIARAMLKARLAADSIVVDEQLAGGAKGTRFMGLVVGSSQQTPPVPVLSRVGGFFALMPGDNSATVAAGAAVEFPQDGPASAGITRQSATQFVLAAPGVYRVFFQVSVTEAGQLMIDLNGSIATTANTVAGRATGTSQIVNEVLITTTAPNTVLRVINPTGNATALTITPSAGGTHAVSAWLTIEQLS